MAAPLVKPILCPILIGRGPYLSALKKCLDEAAAGHGQVVLVTGEAGIGKSRLISEVSTYATTRGFRSATGHCFEQDEALPYAPLFDVLRTLLRAAGKASALQALRPFTSELIRILPDLSGLFSDVTPEPERAHEPEQEKRRLVHAFTLLVSEMAARQPLFLFIEDLHWCDEASLDALLYLARHLAAHPVLLVLTYRSDEVHAPLGHMLTQLDRERLAAEMRLRPLNVTEVEAMLRAIFGLAQPVRADQLNLVYGLSDGNPFFVEEMLRTLASADMALSRAALMERSPLDAPLVPRTVEEAVERRILQLSPPAHQLVALAAVAGRTFTFPLLQALTEQGERQILEQLKELIAAQLIIEVSDERFAFRHALTRQAVYAGLLARERQTLHRRIAEVLERATDPPNDAHLGDLAYHFSKAAAWGQALIYARRAGERALALYAPRSALEHLMRAMEAAEHLPDAPMAPLHRLCGQAYEILGDFEAARARYGEALETAHSSGDSLIEWSSMIDLGNLWAGRDYAEAGAFYRQAAELAQSREDARAHAHSLNRVGNWFANTGRMKEGIDAHQRALMLFEEQEDLAGQAATLDLMGMAYGLNAELPNAMREFSQAIELLRTLGDRRGLSSCLASRLAFASGCMTDTTVSALMTLDECVRDARDAEECAREMEWSAGLAYVLLQMGRAEVAFGEFGPGLARTREALRIAREIEHQQWTAAAHYALGRAYLTLLASGRAIPELETGLALARKLGSAVWIGLITADLARAYRQQGKFAKAQALLSDVVSLDALSNRSSLTLAEREFALAWAQLNLQHGNHEAALRIIAHLYETAPHSASEQPITELLLVRGEALMRLRRWDEAEQALEGAKRGGVQRMNPSSLWRAQALIARLYHATQRVELARQAWVAAHTLVERLAATIEEADLRDAFLQAARADMPRAARVPHPRRVPRAPDLLSAREREVAELIAGGKSNHEIADALVVSERTVTTHVSHILGKLGFTSRTQIVAWLLEGPSDEP
ncbi:MAG: helix-turn-helix transcriptional regulator [Ktedonobacterales bacterium]